MIMNKLSLLLLIVSISSQKLIAQSPEQISSQQSKEVYQQPLDQVLKNIEQRYKVHLIYEPKNTNGKKVEYAVWRFRSDVRQTLDNVLKPLDMVWKDKGKDSFEITKFEYFRKEFSEGRKQLEVLEQ